MTELLEQAFQAASKLPAQEQNRLAAWILKELQSEEQWDNRFALSQDVLAALADEALQEYRTSQTQELDPDKL